MEKKSNFSYVCRQKIQKYHSQYFMVNSKSTIVRNKQFLIAVRNNNVVQHKHIYETLS